MSQIRLVSIIPTMTILSSAQCQSSLLWQCLYWPNVHALIGGCWAQMNCQHYLRAQSTSSAKRKQCHLSSNCCLSHYSAANQIMRVHGCEISPLFEWITKLRLKVACNKCMHMYRTMWPSAFCCQNQTTVMHRVFWHLTFRITCNLC